MGNNPHCSRIEIAKSTFILALSQKDKAYLHASEQISAVLLSKNREPNPSFKQPDFT